MRRLAKRLSSILKPRNRKIFFGVFTVAALFFVALGVLAPAHAGILPTMSDVTAGIASYVAYPIMSFMGRRTLQLIGILIQVAQYNDFIHAEAVQTGWQIARDVSNMFFIMIMLLIAFGTMFGIKEYRYSALLRKVIVNAVLINFSLTIVGFFIDIMQVIMLTFVNAFADTAAGNLTTAVGLQKFLALDPSVQGQAVTQADVFTTILLGVVLIAILFCVVAVYVVIFIARVFALWFLAILSPFAFLLGVFPFGQAQEASKTWWKNFWKYATIGPILAFFLWLSLTITAPTGVHKRSPCAVAGSQFTTSELVAPNNKSGCPSTTDTGSSTSSDLVTTELSQISSSQGILSFIITIMLLVMSLQIASKAGVAGGGLAGKLEGNIKKRGTNLASAPFRGAWAGAKGVANLAYGKTLQRPIEGTAMQAMAVLSRVPVVSTLGQMGYAGLRKRQKASEKKYGGYVEEADTDTWAGRQVVAGALNGFMGPKEINRSTSYGTGARIRAAQKKDPSVLPANDLATFLQKKAKVEDMKKYDKETIARIQKKLAEEEGGNIASSAPRLAETILRSKDEKKIAAAELENSVYDPVSDKVLGKVALEALKVANPVLYGVSARQAAAAERAAEGEKPGEEKKDEGGEKGGEKEPKKIAGISRAVYDATHAALTKDAKFFASAEYAAGKASGKYLDEGAYGVARRRDEAQMNAIRTGTLRANELTVGRADRDDMSGKSMGLMVNGADPRFHMLGMAESGDSGMYATQETVGADGQRLLPQVAEAARAAYLQDHGAREEERLMTEAAKQGGGTNPEVFRQQARAQVQQQADLVRDNIMNAQSVRVLDKMALSPVLHDARHEHGHAVIEGMDAASRQQVYNMIPPERRQQLEDEVRGKWKNGEKMDNDAVQHEVLAELYATSRGTQGRLSITPEQDGEVALLLRSLRQAVTDTSKLNVKAMGQVANAVEASGKRPTTSSDRPSSDAPRTINVRVTPPSSPAKPSSGNSRSSKNNQPPAPPPA